jgi:hypothetical protein
LKTGKRKLQLEERVQEMRSLESLSSIHAADVVAARLASSSHQEIHGERQGGAEIESTLAKNGSVPAVVSLPKDVSQSGIKKDTPSGSDGERQKKRKKKFDSHKK